MCIIFCEIVLCLLKFEEHVSQKKKKKLRNMRLKKNVCVLRNVFLEFKKKKLLAIIFMRNEVKFYFLVEF